MAGSYTDYLEDKVLRHVFTNTTYTPPATIYVGLFTVAPTDTGGGTEVSGTNYARQSAAFSVSGTGTTATNSANIEYPAAGSAWGTVVAVALFDASTAGNMLAWADLISSRSITAGDIFRIPASGLTITQT